MTHGVDLAELSAPIVFSTPALGQVLIEARGSPFRDWLESGRRTRRWAHGNEFVRDLLSEQAVSSADRSPIERSKVALLADEDLDSAARAILEASGRLFAARLIEDPAVGRRTYRQRREHERYNLARRDNESESDRLLRAVSDWIEDHYRHIKMIAATVRSPMQDFAQAIERAYSPFTQVLQEQRRLFSGPLPPSALLESIRTVAEPSWAKSLRNIGWVSPLLSMTPTVMTSDLFGPTGELGRLQETMRSILDSAAYRREAFAGILSNQATFAAAVARGFTLPIPRTTLAALAAMQTSFDGVLAMERSIAAANMLRPGFQMAAALGLDGLAARGMVADILHHYEEAPRADAPVFGSALEAVHMIDLDDLSASEAATLVERAWQLISTAIAHETDVIRRDGILAALPFIVSLVVLHVTIQTLEIAKQGATSHDIAVLTSTVEDVRSEVAGLRTDGHDRDARIRYVHARAPLRAAPHAQSPILRIVYPDQLLRAVDQRGSWVRVEVFDYHSDKPITGWISRRHLRHKTHN